MTKAELDAVVQSIYFQFLQATVPFLIAIVYAASVILDLQGVDAGSLVAGSLVSLVLFVLIVPFVVIRAQVVGALSPRTVGADARLTDLLILPRRLELALMTSVLAGVVLPAAYATARFQRSGWALAEVFLIVVVFNTLIGSRFLLRVEELLRPAAIAEFHRNTDRRAASGSWLYWPRFVWYLHYLVGSIILCALVVLGAVVFSRGQQVLTATMSDLRATGHGDVAVLVSDRATQLVSELAMPLLILGAFTAVLAFLTVGQLARRYSLASVRLQEALEALAAGQPRMPDWIGTDEFGDLSGSLANVLGRLKSMTSTLQSSARQLAGSAVELGESTTKQNEMLTRQAAAMQETEVTAQEIRQTSVLAAQKTESVLKTAERAEEISRTGGSAIEQSMTGLTEVRGEVTEMASRIKALGERARQIASITTTVKDLADQSNMLALNAAIEAVRSGEHGKGFAVVAREIRSLADQSIQATNRVREILDDIGDAIRSTVVITERGVGKVEGSLVQVQSSGESLRELSSIVRDNTQAVRQIAAAVGQQNAGIGQIFEAVSDLSRMMDDTMARLKSTEGAVAQVRHVADEVNGVVRRYGGEGARLSDVPVPVGAAVPGLAA
jgi:methyl-accepting chemotaxis protein